jgi:hypothetical protein
MNYATYKEKCKEATAKRDELIKKIYADDNLPLEAELEAAGYRAWRLSPAAAIRIKGGYVEMTVALDAVDIENGGRLFDLTTVHPRDLVRASCIKAMVDEWTSGRCPDLPDQIDSTWTMLGNLASFARVGYLAAESVDGKTVIDWNDLPESTRVVYIDLADAILTGKAKNAEQLHELIRAEDTIGMAAMFRGDAHSLRSSWADLTEQERLEARVFFASVLALKEPS